MVAGSETPRAKTISSFGADNGRFGRGVVLPPQSSKWSGASSSHCSNAFILPLAWVGKNGSRVHICPNESVCVLMDIYQL